jgi:hypothetical protein
LWAAVFAQVTVANWKHTTNRLSIIAVCYMYLLRCER